MKKAEKKKRQKQNGENQRQDIKWLQEMTWCAAFVYFLLLLFLPFLCPQTHIHTHIENKNNSNSNNNITCTTNTINKGQQSLKLTSLLFYNLQKLLCLSLPWTLVFLPLPCLSLFFLSLSLLSLFIKSYNVVLLARFQQFLNRDSGSALRLLWLTAY